MKAKDVMTAPAVSVGPTTPVPAIARLLLARHISAVPVVDGLGSVIGMVSEGDLMRRPESETEGAASWWLALLAGPEERAARYLRSHGLEARDVMTREVFTITPEATAGQCMAAMTDRRIRHLPVLEGGRVVGVISIGDVVRAVVDDQRFTIRQLRSYILGER